MEVAEIRAEYRENNRCMRCFGEASLVHEITGGMGLRRIAVQDKTTWLALCHSCHMLIHENPGQWPKSRQMAIKISRDPENFDLDRINYLLSGGTKGHPVDLADIAKYLEPV